MKVEQLMVQYLYQNKKVTLQDVGSFFIAPGFDIIADNDKEVVLPEGAIQFEYNTKATQDEGLIDFIVQHSRKIKPLATSDLESYSILSRQFLNIGKPLIIDGLGILQKNQKGTYDFYQGHAVTSKMEAAPVAMREKQQEEISFATKPREKTASKSWMLAGLLTFALVTLFAVYYFMTKENSQQPLTENNILLADTSNANAADTSATRTADTSLVNRDTTAVRAVDDGFSFKVVIKEYPNKSAAEKAFQKLQTYGHKLVLTARDSSTYKISMPFTGPLTDTLRVKDSLRRFFGGKPYVEL